MEPETIEFNVYGDAHTVFADEAIAAFVGQKLLLGQVPVRVVAAERSPDGAGARLKVEKLGPGPPLQALVSAVEYAAAPAEDPEAAA